MPTPAAEDIAPARPGDPHRLAQAGRLRGARRRRPARGARARRPELAVAHPALLAAPRRGARARTPPGSTSTGARPRRGRSRASGSRRRLDRARADARSTSSSSPCCSRAALGSPSGRHRRVALAAGEERRARRSSCAASAGAPTRLGDVSVRCGRPLRPLRLPAGDRSAGPPLRVYPRAETLRAADRAARDAALRRQPGRPARGRRGSSSPTSARSRPGDPAAERSTGGRARAAQSLVVSERHPERNSDVILFLDTFAELGAATAARLDLAVRAAPRSPRATWATRTGSAWSASAASCAGSCPAAACASCTRSSRRCSTTDDRLQLRLEGGRASSPAARCRRTRS